MFYQYKRFILLVYKKGFEYILKVLLDLRRMHEFEKSRLNFIDPSGGKCIQVTNFCLKKSSADVI